MTEDKSKTNPQFGNTTDVETSEVDRKRPEAGEEQSPDYTSGPVRGSVVNDSSDPGCPLVSVEDNLKLDSYGAKIQ